MPRFIRLSAKLIFLLPGLSCACALATDHAGGRNFPAGSGGVNAPYQLDKPYLILVSIDGFRWDYQDLYATPMMDKLASEGARAERLVPVFPTLTFPNHYSMATGLFPAHHGLTANDFPVAEMESWYRIKLRETVEDGRYYQGEPFWVTAETQGMVAASFYWVGSEADVLGVRPSHWRRYDDSISGNDRVDQILEWLAEPRLNRPHLYTLYFEEVDDYAHWYGPGSREGIDAIARVDGYIGRLVKGLKKLPHGDQVNIVLVSDHGQASYIDGGDPLVLEQLVDLEGVSSVDGGCYLFLHFDRPDRRRAVQIRDVVNSVWSHGNAYLSDDAPAAWQVTDNPRFPDVILVADLGYAVLSAVDKSFEINAGDHGWAPEADEMHGIFLAWGPDIRKGIKVGPARVVDVYPFVLSVLGLSPPASMDGDAAALSGILRNP